jgi:hypothetical protein
MIVTLRHKGLKLLYEKNDRSRLRPDIAAKAERFLLPSTRQRNLRT